jgi:hypothetical protein
MNSTLMFGNYTLHYGQAQPVAPFSRCVEGIEQARHLFFGNTSAPILDGDLQRFAFGLCCDANAPLALAALTRVENQVKQGIA